MTDTNEHEMRRSRRFRQGSDLPDLPASDAPGFCDYDMHSYGGGVADSIDFMLSFLSCRRE